MLQVSLKTKAYKKFITATSTTSAYDCIKQHCNLTTSIETLFLFGGVWFNKKRLFNAQTYLQKGDTLIVYISQRLGQRYVLDPDQIIYETTDWMVVHKPATISAVPDRSHLFWNMTAAVSAYCQQSSPGYDCQPINRLDWLVEGLMLFAKNKQAEKDLFKLSQAKKITKGYLAIMPTQTSNILKVTNKLQFKAKAYLSANGKPATTWFIKQQDYQQFSVYRAVLLAGKRHQIRFHAGLKLAPLLGDYFYQSNYKTVLDQVGLIADTITFWWQKKRYKIKLPNANDLIVDIADQSTKK